MLLLNANPLEDVSNSQEIAGVFFNGQFFNRTALDDLLKFVEQQASSIHTNFHSLWDGIYSPLFQVQLAD